MAVGTPLASVSIVYTPSRLASLSGIASRPPLKLVP